ncbi:hypothetical protein DBL03_20665 [Pseudomonas putida]|nr:hypothetical protein DBL03_20665 [Pseudomonas putida]
MECAARHLHAFAIETGLAPEEWLAGITFLTATGQMSSAHRQEFSSSRMPSASALSLTCSRTEWGCFKPMRAACSGQSIESKLRSIRTVSQWRSAVQVHNCN